jgi:tol-pal system protein YbgF
MTRTRVIVTVALAFLIARPATSAAANKEHQQLMAELRMLQEQQQQLQQMLGTLGDALKTLTTKLDDQSGVTRKAFADQKLLIEGVGEGVRILREKADDTNVRLSTINQELEAVRQTIASQPQTTAPATVPGPGDPPPVGGAAVVTPAPTTAPPVGVAPQRIYDNAYADYVAGQYDLAVIGFETFIKTSPRSELADDAQHNIGNALYAAGKAKEAVEAYQAVIANYPQSNSVPSAYYKLGLSYEQLKQPDLARKAFETVIKNYPTALTEASLARQALERMNRKSGV